jgi:hypothetical protein
MCGVDLGDAPETTIGVGGGNRRVRFATVRLQLFGDVMDDESDPLDEWEAEVGFLTTWEPFWALLLGGIGFFDRYTVVMNRAVPGLAVEPYDHFDGHYGVIVQEFSPERQPRFQM